MFTKITRIGFIFVLALIASLMLVACTNNGGGNEGGEGGEGGNGGQVEPTPEPVVVLPAPTSLTISVEFAPLDENKEIKATSVGGDDICLEAEVNEGANPDVVWVSYNEDIATVDENGFVTPVSEGLATIVAYSAVAPAVQAEIQVRVHPTDVVQLLLEAIEYVKENVKYLNGNEKTRLPAEFKSNILSYQYKTYETKEEYRNNVFTATKEWRKAQVDSQDMIRCVITYIPTGVYRETSFPIYVVKNVANNDFMNVDAAEAAITALFANENLEAYEKAEKSLAITVDPSISVSWVSSNDKILKVSQENGVYKVEYTRPLDNTSVTLTATVMSAGTAGKTCPIEVIARGYTEEEKIAYFKDTVCAGIPASTAEVRKDVILPTYDSLFDLVVTWSSDHPELLSATGVYTDDTSKDYTQGTKVTLTATVLYLAVDELSDGTEEFTSANSFRREVKFELNVHPCTDSARAANAVAAYTKEHIADGNGWFPWGKIDRASNQLTGLPATAGAAGVTGAFEATAITWTCSEEGLFDEDWNLLKQYLRYHQVVLTGTGSFGGTTETIEVPLNVGIAQKERTAHIGGSFSRLAVQTNETATLSMDSLQTISAFDGLVGTRQTWYKERAGQCYEIIMGANEDLTKNVIVQPTADDNPEYGTTEVTMKTQFGIGVNCGFAGLTMYWDDPDTGIRFQYYASEAMTWVIGPENVDENGDLVDPENTAYTSEGVTYYGKLFSMLDRHHSNWDAVVIVNMSGKDIKVPVTYSKDYDPDSSPTRQTTYTPYKEKIFGCKEKYGSESVGEISISLFAGKAASVIQPDGKVGLVEAESKWNEYLSNMSSGITTESGTEYCQYVTLPNGGIIWSANSGQDAKYDLKSGSQTDDAKTGVVTMLSTAGHQLTVEFWNIHPCNTFTTNDEWQFPANYTSKLDSAATSSPVRHRDSTVTNVYFWARTLDASKVNPAWVALANAELE